MKGPAGVQSRKLRQSSTSIRSTGARRPDQAGIALSYPWIEERVKKPQAGKYLARPIGFRNVSRDIGRLG
jgi:hypothetical protein